MYDSLYTIISLFDSLYSRMYDSLYTMKGGSEIGKPSDEPKRRQYRMSTPSRTPPLKEANSQIKSTKRNPKSSCRARANSEGHSEERGLLTFENSVV